MTSAIKASDGIIRFWATGDDTAYRRWGERMAEQRSAEGMGTPETLLALSGGSDKGAFGAGLLNGWTRRGDRPSFDIVTGVSTGALIAPFAFLGSSQDATLTQIYTSISSKDVFRQRVLHGLFGGSSLLSSKPLTALIARYVTAAFLDRIAEQHRRGRRLLVMTTQLDAERGVIWDMGAIAASTSPRRLALFRQILLASASIPGAFPPVLISADGEPGAVAEMHVDGGTIAGFFTLPRALLAMSPQTRGQRAIYVIYNGRLTPEFEVTKPRTFAVLSRALSTVLGESDRTNIDDLRKFAGSRGIRFIVCAMMTPTADREAPPFDTMHMREMYREGDEEGTSGRGCLSGGRRNGTDLISD